MAAQPPQPNPDLADATRPEPALDLVVASDASAAPELGAAESASTRSPGGPAHSFIRRLGSPYLGLRSYSQDDADVFFGRDGEVRRVVERLENQRFAAIIGPRACGKTSLALAGLTRALRGGVSDRLGAQWSIAHVLPSERPLDALRESLCEVAQRTAEGIEEPAAGAGSVDLEQRLALVAASLDTARDGLHRAAQHALAGGESNLLLVIDQFERLLAPSSPESVYFVRTLLHAAQATDVDGRPRVFVVAALRDDAVGGSARFAGLSSAFSAGSVILGRPSAAQLERMIVEPAAAMGWRVSRALRAQLLLDLQGEPSPLPLLAHTLHVLSSRPGHDQEIDVADYQALGGLRSAIHQHGEQLYAGDATRGVDPLEERRARLARELFQRLLQWDDAGLRAGEASFAEVAEACDVALDDRDLRAVVRRFSSGPSPFIRVVTGGGELAGDSALELMDFAVVGHWKRLRDWGRRARRDARAYRALVSAALASSTWARASDQGAPDDLLVEPQLSAALRWWEQRRPTLGWAKRHHGTFLAAGASRSLRSRAGGSREEHLALFTSAQQLIERSERHAQEQAEAEQRRRLALERETQRWHHKQRRWHRLVGVFALLAGTGFLLFGLQRQRAAREADEAQQRYAALTDSKQQLELDAQRLQSELGEKVAAERRLTRANEHLGRERDELATTVEQQSQDIAQLEQRNKQITQAHDAALRSARAAEAEVTQVRGELGETRALYGAAADALTVCRSQLLQSNDRAARCESGPAAPSPGSAPGFQAR